MEGNGSGSNEDTHVILITEDACSQNDLLPDLLEFLACAREQGYSAVWCEQSVFTSFQGSDKQVRIVLTNARQSREYTVTKYEYPEVSRLQGDACGGEENRQTVEDISSSCSETKDYLSFDMTNFSAVADTELLDLPQKSYVFKASWPSGNSLPAGLVKLKFDVRVKDSKLCICVLGLESNIQKPFTHIIESFSVQLILEEPVIPGEDGLWTATKQQLECNREDMSRYHLKVEQRSEIDYSRVLERLGKAFKGRLPEEFNKISVLFQLGEIVRQSLGEGDEIIEKRLHSRTPSICEGVSKFSDMTLWRDVSKTGSRCYVNSFFDATPLDIVYEGYMGGPESSRAISVLFRASLVAAELKKDDEGDEYLDVARPLNRARVCGRGRLLVCEEKKRKSIFSLF